MPKMSVVQITARTVALTAVAAAFLVLPHLMVAFFVWLAGL